MKYDFFRPKIVVFVSKISVFRSKNCYKIKNWNLVTNQRIFIIVVYPKFWALIIMSTIGVEMQKIAIQSQLIGLKAVLKISNMVHR